MRVIAGLLGGRSFDSPKGHRTHPMSDKIRGAIFNMLGDLDGLRLLDAYAGSGALAIEAVSRGALYVVAVDSDKTAYRTILRNVQALGIGARVHAMRQNVATWSHEHEHELFDIVIADPPYDDVRLAYIELLTNHVKPRGLLVLSWPGGIMPPDAGAWGFEQVVHKTYGDAQLVIYERSL